ncbi:MAG: hypothetical protein DA330_04750 [Nitrososphaera sp.]|nr:hypothetical protein [Nitrososphaera sp.]
MSFANACGTKLNVKSAAKVIATAVSRGLTRTFLIGQFIIFIVSCPKLTNFVTLGRYSKKNNFYKL